jgi:hypothetical protein
LLGVLARMQILSPNDEIKSRIGQLARGGASRGGGPTFN